MRMFTYGKRKTCTSTERDFVEGKQIIQVEDQRKESWADMEGLGRELANGSSPLNTLHGSQRVKG